MMTMQYGAGYKTCLKCAQPVHSSSLNFTIVTKLTSQIQRPHTPICHPRGQHNEERLTDRVFLNDILTLTKLFQELSLLRSYNFSYGSTCHHLFRASPRCVFGTRINSPAQNLEWTGALSSLSIHCFNPNGKSCFYFQQQIISRGTT